ncbi:MAG TPA: collagenase-like protease [Porphyromonadaceae bacterium]|nr:collagenase-like protease [Porphyromonadaceae bacterium]
MNVSRPIELLAPAKTADIGIEAVLHGADAVYIGGPCFGARAAAANSVNDIARLVDFAHRYEARVYVTLNTLLYDDELKPAERLIAELYRVGVDALIVQDMGVLRLDIPPIALHASTQTDNRTVEKVRFLYDAGFSRVVLARELSGEQIRTIAEMVPVELEVFVHGALCVSYSGQCYLSRALSGRSANRGECAQYCRLPYTLLDADRRPLIRDKHLLSLKDMNRTDRLEALLDAGATSLKIEGRLKELSYVKNVTAWYRRRLDEIFERRPEYRAASSGRVELSFEPMPQKSFNRSFTRYFFDGRPDKDMGSPDTPKSLGEPVGRVVQVRGSVLKIQGSGVLHNGDGLCFLNKKGVFEGFRVNRVEDALVYPFEKLNILSGTLLYRNYDRLFEQALQKKSAQRRIPVDLRLYEIQDGFALKITDNSGRSAVVARDWGKEEARTPQIENQKAQLSRLGDTCFEARSVDVLCSKEYFLPASLLADLRRETVDRMMLVRRLSYRLSRRREEGSALYPVSELDYLGNVSNASARAFYQAHGVKKIAPAYECEPVEGVALMFTRFCLKRQWGRCPRENVRPQGGSVWKEPLFLQYRDTLLRLEFDCRLCQMRLYRVLSPKRLL